MESKPSKCLSSNSTLVLTKTSDDAPVSLIPIPKRDEKLKQDFRTLLTGPSVPSPEPASPLKRKAPTAEEEEVEFVDLKLKAKVRPNKSFRPKLLTEPQLPLMLFPFCRSVGNTSRSNRCRDRRTACKARISKAFSWPLCSSLLAGVIFQSVQ